MFGKKTELFTWTQLLVSGVFGWEQPGCRSSGRHLGKGALPILIALSCSVFFLLPWIIATAPTHTPAWPLHLQPMQSPGLYFKSAKYKPEHNYITPPTFCGSPFLQGQLPYPSRLCLCNYLSSASGSHHCPLCSISNHSELLGVPSLCHFLQVNPPLVNFASTI